MGCVFIHMDGQKCGQSVNTLEETERLKRGDEEAQEVGQRTRGT